MTAIRVPWAKPRSCCKLKYKHRHRRCYYCNKLRVEDWCNDKSCGKGHWLEDVCDEHYQNLSTWATTDEPPTILDKGTP